MTTNDLTPCGAGHPVMLDGATGSQLRAKGMPVGVSTELWAYEHPEVIVALQRAYVDAGSDIIYAPTFMANRVGLGMHGLEHRLAELNAGLVKLSKRAAGGRALVAGDFTTTGKPLEPVGPMSYQALLDVYREQIEVVAEAGADLLVAETMLSIDETACAVEAAMSVCDLPVMCSLTMEADGHLLFGGSAVEAVETLQALGASAVGLNCSVGPDQLEAVVRAMKAVATVPGHRQAQRRHAGDGRQGHGPLQHDPGRLRRRHDQAGRRRGRHRRRLLRHRSRNTSRALHTVIRGVIDGVPIIKTHFPPGWKCYFIDNHTGNRSLSS